MLIFISDLHFSDGTAGEHNIPSRAFDYFFDDIVSIANKPTNNIKEIKLVLLGDIFDLLRTENWFGYPPEERPWGHREPAMEVHAQTIFDAVADHPENRRSLERLRHGLKRLGKECPLKYEPRLIYLPGNHDRLVNKYSSLRVKICECLGIRREWHNPAQPFPHTHEDLAYGVFARHGHEFDGFNYEGEGDFTEEDYLRVPIGDPITTELLSRLPYELDLILEARGFSPDLRRQVKDNFQALDEVRPLGAVIEWLLYRVKQQPEDIIHDIQEAVEEAIDAVVANFRRLSFVKNWYAAHDQWSDPVDEADLVQTFLLLLTKIKFSHLEKLMPLLEKVKAQEFFLKDHLLEAAPGEYSQLDPRIRYVVYGHTHDALAAPLRSLPSAPTPLERVYLNTGTWRTRHHRAYQDDSFISWKNLTYVIFYREGEREATAPVFETWTGALKME